MLSVEIAMHVRPTWQQIAWARGRLFLRTSSGVYWVAAGFLAPPVLRAMYGWLSEAPWSPSSNIILIVAPAVSLAILAANTVGGLNHPNTRAYLREGARYTFDDRGATVRTATAESVMKWEAFDRAVELADIFVLFTGVLAHFLPKRDLSPAACDGLRDLLREQLGTRAKLSAPLRARP